MQHKLMNMLLLAAVATTNVALSERGEGELMLVKLFLISIYLRLKL